MLSDLIYRFRALFGRKSMEADMDEELYAHLERKVEKYVQSGLGVEEAKRRARLDLGGVEQVKEECRDSWGVQLIEELVQDIRYGLRQLRRSPGFTAVAVLTLAIGVGANTAIFSMVDGIMLRALPYFQPQHLYVVNEVVPQWSRYAPSFGVNSGNFLLWQRECPAFSAMALVADEKYDLTGLGLPRQIRAAEVSADFFSMMGVQPQLGRSFLAEEESPGRNHEAVLTDQFWRQAFNADPRVIGQPVNLDGAAYTVVGILPAGFRFPELSSSAPELLTPIALAKYDLVPGVGNFRYTVIARLKPGESAKQALAQINVVEARIARQGDSMRGVAPGQYDLRAMLTPLKAFVIGPVQKALWMLVVAAAFVLLIICVNLANLMLVKNTGRSHEVALRSALGARPGRLARQFLTEGFVLAAAGAALGLLFAEGGLRLLIRNAPIGIPRVDSVRIDPRVLFFALCISIVASLLFAFLPSLRLARVAPVEALKSAGPTLSGGKAGARLRDGLVVGEIALCSVLLAGALLLIESLSNVVRANQWMEEQHVLALSLVMPAMEFQTDAQLYQFYSSVLDKVEALPGVASSGFTDKLPLQGNVWGDDIAFQEAPRPPSKMEIGDFYFVSPGYFSALRQPLIKGRFLSEDDRDKDVALISESVARRLLPGRNPIGMHLLWSANEPAKAREVIGVVADIRTSPDKPPALAVYVPIWSFSERNETLVVRTAMDPNAAAVELRRAVWSVDHQVAVPQEQTLKTIVETSQAPRRYETSLGALFAFCALIIAALGLYGVVSYSVIQRTHEIGIRMALGAEKTGVLTMVVGQGFKLTLIGVGIGVIGALALTRFLSSLLYGVKSNDPLTFVAVSLILIVVALLASYIPARRAAKVDPLVALRYE
jgi:putative ABC transport system permease protein